MRNVQHRAGAATSGPRRAGRGARRIWRGHAPWRLGAVAAASLALTVAACTGTPAGGQGAGSAQLTIAAVPGAATAPLTVAVKDGLFRQHGVSVTVRAEPSVAAAYRDLARGRAQVAAGDYSAFFYAAAGGQRHLRLVADGYDAAPGTIQVLTRPNSAIRAPKDLAGHTVGTPQPQVAPFRTIFPYNIETLTTESVLQGDGISPGSITWRPMPADQLVSALATGKVSAIVATEPYIVRAQTQLGAVELLDSCSGVTTNLPLSGYFSTAAVAAKQAGALRGFRAALAAAQADAGNRRVVQAVLRRDHLTAEDAALANVGQYPTFANAGQIQRVADLMLDIGMIANPVDVRGMLLK